MNPEKKHNHRHNCAPLTMTKATMCINTSMNETGKTRRCSTTTASSIPFIVVLLMLICAFPSWATAFRDSERLIDTTKSNPSNSDSSVMDDSHGRPDKSSVVDKLNAQERDGHKQKQDKLPNGDQIPSGSYNDQTVTSVVTTTLPSGLDAKHEDSFTALDVAILNGNLDIARELCKKMDIATPWLDDSSSPLLWAACADRMNVVKELVNKGADTEVTDGIGRTPLHRASEKGHLNVVKFLVESKADIQAKDNVGKTPLFLASENGHLDVVQFLVENKAAINAKNNYGLTPLDIAKGYNYISVADYLRSQGAIESNSFNHQQITAAHNSTST